MSNKDVAYGIGGLVVGAAVMALVMGGFSQDAPSMSEEMADETSETAVKQDETSSHAGMSMGDMNDALKGKTGDEFDKAFIELMVEHHQGAIDMADLIEGRAKHDEIKQLGKAIIAAQTKEIMDMKAWAKSWGYAVGNEPDAMMH